GDAPPADTFLERQRAAVIPSRQADLDRLTGVPRYTVTATLDAADLTLTGRQTIRYINSTDNTLKDIMLRLYPNLPQYMGGLGIDEVWVGDQILDWTYEADDTAARLFLPQPLAPREMIHIDVDFHAQARAIDQEYVLFGQARGLLSLPSALPLLAVHGPDGWRVDVAETHGDATLTDIALFEVRLTAPELLPIVTTGVEITTTRASGTRITHHIVSGPARDFCIFAGPDLRMAQTQADEATVFSYYQPVDSAAGHSALWEAAAALRIYNRLFGPGPLAEFKIIEAPLGVRGMEYPGLSLIGDGLYAPGQLENQEFLVAHEVGHQWWYNLVGNDPLLYPWQDEGLTEYNTSFYYHLIYGPAQAQELKRVRWTIPAESLVTRGRDAPIGKPVSQYPASDYEAVVYAKGALFFDAVYQAIGDVAYFTALRAYCRDYGYRQAAPADLVRAFEEASGQDLGDLYQQWVQGE
ncbi:MAG: M1 family metallopeptidase, partial [Chloroflexi bacterium]|nr:M1 family metallopeptidase [Chloroflexota bacterium]